MTGFTAITSKAMPLDQANVDTDQIIPKQFLTAVTRTGFGKHLFNDWRYKDNQGQFPNQEFVLNKTEHEGAQILLSRENFGCGSSREHAPWALTDYGFKAIIATSFADIFYGNCMNNQLLPVQLASKEMDEIFAAVTNDANTQVTIDLPTQTVSVVDKTYSFEINPFHKDCILKGLDNIGLTLIQENEIQEYEKNIPIWRA